MKNQIFWTDRIGQNICSKQNNLSWSTRLKNGISSGGIKSKSIIMTKSLKAIY